MAADDVANANLEEAAGGGAREPSEASFSSDGDGNHHPQERGGLTPTPTPADGSRSPEPTACSESSGFSDDDSLHMDDGRGLSIQSFLEQLETKGRRGLYDDYWEIKARPPAGTFSHSM